MPRLTYVYWVLWNHAGCFIIPLSIDLDNISSEYCVVPLREYMCFYFEGRHTGSYAFIVNLTLLHVFQEVKRCIKERRENLTE